MIIKHECKSCGVKFELVNGETLAERIEDGLAITYVECPICKITEDVQVDNLETREIMRSIVAKVRQINISGKKTEKQSAQLKNLERRLKTKREKLLEEYKHKRFECKSC